MIVTLRIKFISFLSIVSFSTFAQTHLKLVLNTKEPIDSAFIVHYTDKESIWLPFKDTLQVNFNTAGNDFYHINYLGKGKVYNAQVYLDTGNIQIVSSITNGKLKIDTVVGSPMYYTQKNWDRIYNSLIQRKDSVAIDSFLLKSYEDNLDNPFSFNIGLRYLKIHQNDRLKLYALLPLIAMQNDAVKKRHGFSMLNDRLQGIIKNDFVKLSSYKLVNMQNRIVHPQPSKAKYVILDFWFVGCVPCMQDHMKIPKLLPDLKKKQTEFISISYDDSYKKWKDYLDKHKYKWQQYKKTAANDNIISQLGIATYPTYILLDNNDKILYSTYSLEEVLNLIKK